MSETYECAGCGVRIFLPRGGAFRPACLGDDDHEAQEMDLVEP